MRKAITDLGEHKQNEMVGDIFEIYFKEHVLKMKTTDEDPGKVENEYLFELCELIQKYGEGDRVHKLLQTVVQECVSEGFVVYNQRLCGKVAHMF